MAVFLASAVFFKAEGRGVITYGTSIFSVLGMLLSLNLGRSYILTAGQSISLKIGLVKPFVSLNMVAAVISFVGGILFWTISDQAQQILRFVDILAVSASSVFYIWSINSSFIFAGLSKIFIQDIAIFISRLILIVFLILYWLYAFKDLETFLWGYSCILVLSVLIEVFILLRLRSEQKKANSIDEQPFFPILRNSVWPHLDYLAINLFPVLLVVISGWYMGKAQIGQSSLALQALNVVFLITTTASIRITSYVSGRGFRHHLEKVRKLFLFSLIGSINLSIIIYILLRKAEESIHFESFSGVSNLFFLSCLSLPGFIAYQFLYPIWIELKAVRRSTIYNLIVSIFFICISPVYLKISGNEGIVALFSMFYMVVLIIQFYHLLSSGLFKQLFRN